MDQAVVNIAWDELSDEQLTVLERKIASKYKRIIPWGAVVWGLGNFLIWLSLWPLVMMDILPLWLAFPLATVCIALAYLPSHEAQHGIIAGKGQPLRWLNELVGHVSLIPMASPFRVMRHTHFEHHKHANNPELDPDYGVTAKSGLHFLGKILLNRQPGSATNTDYADALQRTGNGHLLVDAVVYQLVFLSILFSLAWSGYAIEAALLWWLPKHIGTAYIQYYLSWAPHHPGVEQGRYRDTRAFKSRLGNIASSGMQYHIIHHLHPTIPLSKTPAAYRELRPILVRRNCDLGEL